MFTEGVFTKLSCKYLIITMNGTNGYLSYAKFCVHLSMIFFSQGLWTKFYDASNLSSETIEVKLEESVMENAMSQYMLNPRTEIDDLNNGHENDNHDDSEEFVAENNLKACEESNFQLPCVQQNFTQETLNACNSSIDDITRSSEKSNDQNVCECGQKLVCRTCDFKSSENLRTTVNHEYDSRKWPFSARQRTNAAAEKCCLCFQNRQEKSSDISYYKICHTCYQSSSSGPTTRSKTDPNKIQTSEVSPQRLCSADGKDFCSRQHCDTGVEICEFSDVLNAYSVTDKENITNSKLFGLPWNDLCMIIQKSLHKHLTREKQLEKCLALLELLKIHFTAMDESEGFDQDFLKFCCLKFRETDFFNGHFEGDLGVSKSKFMTILSMWLGTEFYKCSTIISSKVDDFKQQHINCIDNLPPSIEIVRHIFPVFMSTFLLHWQGFSSDFNEMNETQLTLEHNYISKKLKMDVPQSCPNYPLIQLILEFANNALISGVAHVVFSKIKYTN